jgi:hypothetical protein
VDGFEGDVAGSGGAVEGGRGDGGDVMVHVLR